MKKRLFLTILIAVFLVSFVPKNKAEYASTFDYYFAYSKKTWIDQKDFGKWTEKNDTALITLGYFRGDCCGGVPSPEKMAAKILHDTLYYDYRTSIIPNCDSRIGICGATIDFVINAKKYPNYKSLILSNKVLNNSDELMGKTYIAKIREACKEMSTGGCMIYTYEVLKFKKDFVEVFYTTKATCTPKELEKNYEHLFDNVTKTYKWAMHNNVLTIEGLEDFSTLTFTESKLVGSKGVVFSKAEY